MSLLESIQDGSITDYFGYDDNGNLTRHAADEDWVYFWDEANRLRSAVLNEGKLFHNIYDASGERTLKAQGEYQALFENGIPTDGGVHLNAYTTYPSPYITVSPNETYTKHYFTGTQRIASKPKGKADIFNTSPLHEYEELKFRQLGDIQAVADTVQLGVVTIDDPIVQPIDSRIYYFHPDHLGTSTMISDGSGYAYQFFLNLPFGETFAEQRLSGNLNNPYKFNGKELDEETGLYYYGARYYNPRTSVFISVDPLAEQAPNWTPYRYGFNNPIRYTDPTGLWETDYINIDTGEKTRINDGKDQVIAASTYLINSMLDSFDNDREIYDLTLNTLENSKYNLNMTSKEFMFFAETLYAESSGGYRESLGIVNVLENRASNEGTTILDQLSASPPYGVYGIWKTSKGKNSNYKYAYQNETGYGVEQKKKNIHRAIAVGLITDIDVSNGAYFWDGIDIKTNSHYKKWGLKFSDPLHNLWGLKETSGASQLITTQAIGETTFSKFLNQGTKWYLSK